MPNITFLNPYVDWAMALKPASDDLHFPVFFEGARDEINTHLLHAGLCLGSVSGNNSGNMPKALRVCVTNSVVHNTGDRVSGFYYLSRQDLNARFRRQFDEAGSKTYETRILALWQQSMDATQSSGDRNSPCDIGRILSRDDIMAQLNALQHKTEFEIYQENNNLLFGRNTHRSTEQNFSHGTAILDVAAGADPADEDVTQDILAVQLPPETLEDTSGTHLPAF